MTDRFTLTVRALLGQPWPMPAPIPGRLVQCRDEPLDPNTLNDVTDPSELRLLLGVSRQRASQILDARKAAP